MKKNKILSIFLLMLILCACEQKPKDIFQESREHFQLGLNQFKAQNMGEAILEFRYTLQIDPSFADPHYYLALAYQQAGALDEAERYFKLYLKFEPEHTDTHLQLFRIYYRKGKSSEVLEEGRLLIDKLPPDLPALTEIHNALGDTYLRVNQDYEAAAYHYRQVIEREPQKPGAYMAFAKIYMAQGDSENAIPLLKKVLELDTENKDALDYLISLYRKENKQEDIITLYKQILEKTPLDKVKTISAVCSELTQIYWQQNKKPLAKEYALKTLEKDFANPPALSILSKIYLQEEQYEEALTKLEILNTQKYNQEETLLDLGLAYRKLDRPMKALDAYEQLVFIRPDDFEAQYYITLLALQTQQWERAIRGSTEILTRFYNYSPVYLFLGKAYMFKENWTLAAKNLDLFFMPEEERKTKAIPGLNITYSSLLPPKKFLSEDLSKRKIEAHYLLGYIYLGRFALPEALREFDYVSQKMPQLGEIYLCKAIVYHLQDKPDQAILSCELASRQVNVNKQLLHFILANIYTGKGDLTLAREHFKQAEGVIYGFSFAKMDVTKNVSVSQPASLANLNLGVLYLVNAWKDHAKTEFAKVLKANPQNPMAKYLDNEIYQLMNKYYYKSSSLSKTIDQIYQE